MADIRIIALPNEDNPVASEKVAIDGATTRGTTIQKLVDSGAPVASQAEAETGSNNVKRMTPLRVKQSIASEVGASIASAASGELANTAVQPEDLGTSAPLDVGTTAGTVAAGDDERFAAALNPANQNNTAVYYGAVRDGVTDDTAAIQALFDDFSDGWIVIPPGTYNLASDLTITVNGDNSGGLSILAYGAVFVGGGKLILNSCKRVSIMGLDYPTGSLCLRGCWFSDFHMCKFREIVIGDAAGTTWSSTYWNNFYGGTYQRIRVEANASFFNANWFHGTHFRGAAVQGFSTTADYAIEVNGAGSVQNLAFFGGDFSDHQIDIYILGVGAPAEVQILFDKVYFDTKVPDRLVARTKTRIAMRDCHVSNDMAAGTELRAATQGGMTAYRNDRSNTFDTYADGNLIPNGNLASAQESYSGSGRIIGSANSASITAQAGGYSGRYLNINQALTASNEVRVRPVGAKFAGRHTAAIGIQNAGAGAKSLNIFYNGLFEDVTVYADRITYITITSEAELTVGQVADIGIRTTDGTAFNVNLYFASVIFGEKPPLVPNMHPTTAYFDELRAVQFRPGSATVKPIWTSGTGSPEGVVTAIRGSVFGREDGIPGGTGYIKEAGTGANAWYGVQTVRSGNTVSRPTGAATGYRYFDTALGKPIWWAGSGWVDAAGATV